MKPYTIARAFKPKEVFGEPRVLLNAMDKDQTGMVLDGQIRTMGVVMGKATGVYVSRRSKPNGDVDSSYGMEGQFEAIPADPERAPIRTNIAWLPTHIHEDIAGQLKENDPDNGVLNEDGADSLEFAFRVDIKSSRASSTGFTWEYGSLVELRQATDPLAHLRAAIPAGVIPQLAGPKTSALKGDAPLPDASEDRGDEPELGEQESKSGNAALAQVHPSPAPSGHKKK